MALKFVLDSLEGLPDAIAKEYKKGDDGKYRLDVDGLEDTGALKRAKDHEKQARKKAEDDARALREKLEKLTEERDNLIRGAIPKDDVDKLENSWKQKLADREKELSGKIESLSANIQTMLVDNVARSIATEISTSPDLILPHVKSRLRAEFTDDGKPATRVLDKTGSPSSLTLDELKKEFVSDPVFAPVIVGSKASGGGTPTTGDGAPGATRIDFSKASPKEIVTYLKSQGDSTGV